MSPVVEVSARGPVLEVILSSTDGQNLVTEACLDGLVAAFAEYGEQTRVVLLTARGENFCAGGSPSAAGNDGPGALAARFHALLEQVEAIAVPVVVAAQGEVAGAGLSLACAGDLLLLADDAQLRARGTHGVRASGGLTWRLPAALGRSTAMDLLLTSRVLTAPEALRQGMAARVVPGDELLERAREVAAEIALQSRSEVVELKALAREAVGHTFGAHLELESPLLLEAALHVVGASGADAP